MSENIFDANQLMMMINILNISTRHLKDEISELKIREVEVRWKELLSTLHNCFAYAQSNSIDLRQYKTDLSEIVDNLYSVEKLVRQKNEGKVSIIDDIAQGVFYIAGKIDDVLAGIGWKRVVQPITEAIFLIPKKIMAMFSGTSETPKILPNMIQNYLPPPMKSLPSKNIGQSNVKRKDDDIIDVEWGNVKDTKESLASQIIRQMHDRISHIESGDE
jgi:hypothetical protein